MVDATGEAFLLATDNRLMCHLKLEEFRDPASNRLKKDFYRGLKNWSLESISNISLNTRVGLLSDKPDPGSSKLAANMSDFFQLSYEYDVVPSVWKYIERRGFKLFLRTYDNIIAITINYIEALEAEPNEIEKSVVGKLCRNDKQVAIVMAMAGIDTSSSAFITILYYIATNREKRNALRKELLTIMPTLAKLSSVILLESQKHSF